MNLINTFSTVMLQASATQADGAAVLADPGLLPRDTFGVEFLIHAAFIWVALIVISMILFAYRRRRTRDRSRGFPDTYQDDLDAMRRKRSDEKA